MSRASFDAARDVYPTLRGRPAGARMMRGHTKSVWACAFFKDGRRVVTGSQDGTLRMWDVQKGALIGGTFKGHQGGVQAVAVSPDDRRITSGGRDNTIIVWDVESKHMVFGRLVKHTGWVNSVCFSPDGKRIASGSADEMVAIWDAETGATLTILEGHRDRVLSVTFSPDGLKLASGSADRTIRVWHTVNAELLLKINTHEHWVESVVWLPDGRQLISASFDKTIKFWNSSNGNQIGQACTGHTEPIYSLTIISSNGSFIATASDDKTVRLWSTSTHQQIGTALPHTDLVHCATISPNGELLVSGDYGGKVWLWVIKDMLEQGKAEERITEDEEARRRQPLSPSVTQLLHHDDNDRPAGNHDSTSHHPSEIHEASGNDQHSLFDILTVNTTVHDASTSVGLRTTEDLLTQEIATDVNNYVLYANRSLSYLHVQLAITAFEGGRYSEAADRFNDSIPSITGDLFSRRALLEPRLKIFTVLFGWDLDSLWQTVNQRRCEAFLRAID
ncbi:WD40-repeat-containing domain protein [Suillus lakei]|nr:WD40-repeat-containing domain protein [Suillus lakei]